jgi:hypothetical protein
MKIRKSVCFFFFVMFTVVLFATVAVANGDEPSGTITLSSKSVAIGIGVQWGDGVLKFKGKEYKFEINGLSLIDVGVSSITATGHVYHLTNVSDFAGTYVAAEVGIALGAGGGAQAMKNQNGVTMKLTSTKAGIKFKLAPEGVKIQLKE